MWCVSVYKVHIALQELQAVTIMLHKVAFWLTGTMVALHLDNITSKAYLYNQGGTASLFLSRLACYILNLADEDGITLLQHAYLPISMLKLTIFHGEDLSQGGTCFLAEHGSISCLGST